ncbi:MAG: hypothetical protein AAFN79_21885 [Pseudomonadota bacterium]
MTNRRSNIAAAMSALGHPRRVRIYDSLAAAPEDGLRFDALMAETGLRSSTLIHHLKPMFAAGLVITRRKGQCVHHKLRPEALDPAIVALRDDAFANGA